jgi:diadenosine tetraphosphate (Ap4A) HIT family hydrolase
MNPLVKVIATEPPCIEDSKNAPWTELISEDHHVAVFKDAYPVTDGHLLYIPKYNTIAVTEDAIGDALRYGLSMVADGVWDGFNIGMNVGESAGQTVSWPHVHLIPRRKGDMDDPRGGVRHVIPEKGNYAKTKCN